MTENNWYNDCVNKLENSKYKFKELTESDIDKIKYCDIAFVKDALVGAMGEPGGIEIVMNDCIFYHTNRVERNEIFNYLLKKIPEIDYYECLGLDNNFKYYYLGFGNNLYVRKNYTDAFDDLEETICKKTLLYNSWKDIAIEILKK